MEMLHFILLTVMLCAMFIIGIVAGREWERAIVEEEQEKQERSKDNYTID